MKVKDSECAECVMNECEETDSVASVMENPSKHPKICEEGKDPVNVVPKEIFPLSDNNGNMEESDIDSILSKDTLPVEDFNVSIEESDEGDNEVESESGCEDEGTEDEDKHVPVGESDKDEDISNFCDWCKKPVPLGQIIGIYEENVCKSCVDNSDLYMNTEGEWQFNHEEIEEYESSESENESSEPEK